MADSSGDSEGSGAENSAWPAAAGQPGTVNESLSPEPSGQQGRRQRRRRQGSEAKGCPRREPEAEERRRQNRDAAARHRQRQQQRTNDLIHREAILKQRVEELQSEIQVLRSRGEGLAVPERDPFTATLLEMHNTVDSLRTSLMACCSESELVVEEIKEIALAVLRRKSLGGDDLR
ncbi:hypothetical protein GGF46_003796 [Coemansia sp. RSA 552]|nr:hypothetical protein GGF46_003796 [Coemansia sp. RSA 552]